MSYDANVNIALYKGLLPEEEKILKGIENDVLRSLFDHGFSTRPIWISRTDDKGRIIMLRLLASSQPTVIFELPANEIATLSCNELLSRLNESLGRHL